MFNENPILKSDSHKLSGSSRVVKCMKCHAMTVHAALKRFWMRCVTIIVTCYRLQLVLLQSPPLQTFYNPYLCDPCAGPSWLATLASWSASPLQHLHANRTDLSTTAPKLFHRCTCCKKHQVYLQMFRISNKMFSKDNMQWSDMEVWSKFNCHSEAKKENVLIIKDVINYLGTPQKI